MTSEGKCATHFSTGFGTLPHKILQNAEVYFLFIEGDSGNKMELDAHLAEHPLPTKVTVTCVCEDYERVIQVLLDKLKADNAQMAPAFVFVDPYGFRLSMHLLAQLKAFERCELFVTFMWRYVDMAISSPTQEQNMDVLFGCPEWRDLREIQQPSDCCEGAIELFRRGLGARFVTWIKMLGENRAIKYVLLHATNHQRGRELMKEAIWSIAPEGDFAARVSDNPQQEFLIQPKPDLGPLLEWLWRKYRGHEVRYQEIENEVLRTVFLPKHLRKVIRQIRHQGKIGCSDYGPRFSFKKNPLISFNPTPEKKRT